MPQLQLPIFPAGVTEINSRIAVQKESGRVCYIHGHLPVFQHEEQDVRSFRMFTSQMIVSGTVKPKEIVQTFGVPMATVKRYTKLYRDSGAKGFCEAKPQHSSASVLKGEVLEQAQRLLDEGRSVPEVAAALQVLANTLHKAIRAGRLRASQKKWRRHNRDNQQERAQPDRQRGGDGKRRDANAGTSGGGDGRAGVGADRVSSHLRRRARWSAAGAAGPVGGRTAELYSSVVPTAQGILRHREPLPAAGVDGAGADPVAGTTALPSAGRMGQTTGAGSNPGSADPAGETETVVPGLGASSPLERGTGQGMDSPAKRHRTVFLLRWPCARISRRPDRFAAPLCGPRAVVSAGHDRLLDQRQCAFKFLRQWTASPSCT